MLHKEFWGLMFLAFVVWVFIGASPNSRIANGCRPVGWSGNVVTSLTVLVLPSQETKIQGWFDNLEYGCQYTAWRLFYQDDYNKYLAEQAAKAEQAKIKEVAPTPSAVPPSSTPSEKEPK